MDLEALAAHHQPVPASTTPEPDDTIVHQGGPGALRLRGHPLGQRHYLTRPTNWT
ncbi:hypothetical protein [Streptomyces sp. NPDC096013]|uniref:hypothetical protein n=1 Tax=Streptomyces sp. NPDC096013 TaxID=3366069 RepID=UPI0037F11E4D